MTDILTNYILLTHLLIIVDEKPFTIFPMKKRLAMIVIEKEIQKPNEVLSCLKMEWINETSLTCNCLPIE